MPNDQTTSLQPKDSWLRRIFAGNGLMWALYFVLVLVSLYTVSSALSSEIYKSLSVGRLNPILKHALMLAIGICSAILLSRCSGRFYRYTLPPDGRGVALLPRASAHAYSLHIWAKMTKIVV